ncbi:hypothetical protein [Balneicella halophila]|nr:hypothetical protein [Balneicella halophila]
MFTMIPGSIITFIAGFRDNHKKAKNNESIDLTGWIWGMLVA